MERNYIIVGRPKAPAVARGGLEAFDFGAQAQAVPEPPSIEFARMDVRDARDRARAPEVGAMVPEMPLTLVKPIAMAEDGDSQGDAWGLAALGASDSPYTGEGVKVAVLDTGIDAQHQAFSGVTLTQVNYTNDSPGDTDGHGTHCAGTIFGRDVRGLRIGVARGITEAYIGKVIGETGGGTAALLRAIRDAVDAGCQIISMSLGFDYPGAAARLQKENDLPPDLAAAIALSDYRANVRLFDGLGKLIQAQRAAEAREILLFAAAGNESKRQLNAAYELPAAPPSEADGFTSIGAVGRDAQGKLRVAPFSNTGCQVCAPGVGVLSAKKGTADELVAFSGTSMATPNAAGIAALYLQRELAQPTQPGGFFKSRPSVLARILGDASYAPLAAGYVVSQVGLGFLRAPNPL